MAERGKSLWQRQLHSQQPLKGDELKINANSNCLVQLKQKVEVGKLDLNVSGSANMVVNELKTDKMNAALTVPARST